MTKIPMNGELTEDRVIITFQVGESTRIQVDVAKSMFVDDVEEEAELLFDAMENLADLYLKAMEVLSSKIEAGELTQ